MPLIQGKPIIMGDNTDEDTDATEIPVAVGTEETRIISMTIKTVPPAEVKDNGTFSIVEGEVKKTHLGGVEDNGMEMTQITVTEITGTEILTVKVIQIGVEDGIIITEVKDIVIVEEGEDGIPVHNIMILGIPNNPNLQTQTTIVHHPWDINTDIQSHMINIHTPNNNNTNRKDSQHHLNKLQIFVSCVIVRVTMTINVNLQVILWPAHKKPLIKADHTAIKILITGIGHMVMMITMILMDNLFSNGGSHCH